jgi:DNA-binding response OmpR family regulator
VVEDDPEIRNLILAALQSAGYELRGMGDGSRVVEEVSAWKPDVLVLDINLPGLDGLSVCRELRRNRGLPILMVSARNEDVDRIVGLEVGADDYLGKPFHPRELVARVGAMFRRLRLAPSTEEPETLQRGDVKLWLKEHRAELGGQELALTPIEFSLLRCLASRPGATLTRQELLDRVWGAEFVGDERTTDSHIRNLRAKLRQANPQGHYIHSVWGVGYKFLE